MFRDLHLARSPSLIEDSCAPATEMVPELGLSRPAMRFRRVVLPEPDGPISASKLPSGTSRLRLSRTFTGSFPRRYVFEMPRIWMIDGPAGAGAGRFSWVGSVAVVGSITRSFPLPVARPRVAPAGP